MDFSIPLVREGSLLAGILILLLAGVLIVVSDAFRAESCP